MSFFKNIFTGGDPLAVIRKAADRRQWADVLSRCDALDLDRLNAEERAEIEALERNAGDSLATVNLEEGKAFLRAGDMTRAADHLDLAATQARTPGLLDDIRHYQGQLRSEESTAEPLPMGCVSSSCGATCSEPSVAVLGDEDADLPAEQRLELILAGYPSEWAEKYFHADPVFLEGFLLAHEGQDEEALAQFDKVSPDARDLIYYFERGALYGRLGQVDKAVADLKRALEEAPAARIVLDILIHFEKMMDDGQAAENRLLELLRNGIDPGFCHGHLAAIYASRDQMDPALEQGLKALSAGTGDPDVIYLTATLLERQGRVGEAEALFSRLSGSGCGSINVALAEFWLRQKKNLDKALDAFKKAAGHIFRTAETYLAKGWEKEGVRLLSSLMEKPDLDDALKKRGMQLLDRNK